MPIIISDAPSAPGPLGVAGSANADIPHLRFPLAIDGSGNLRTVDQNSIYDIEQCVTAILRTPLGLSDSIPDLGLTYQPFYEGGADIVEIQQQLAAHERRTDVLVTEAPDLLDQALSRVGVRLR